MNVRSFDPALTVTRSGLPSKLPTNSGPGLPPTAKIGGFWSLKKPPPTPGSNATLFDRLLLTRMSGDAAAGDVPDDGGHRPEPAWSPLSRGPSVNVQPPPDRPVEQDGDVVGALVGDDQVGEAVAVEVGDGEADRVGPDEEAVPPLRPGRTGRRPGRGRPARCCRRCWRRSGRGCRRR